MEPSADPYQRKQQIRSEALARRHQQEHKDHASREICRRLLGLDEYSRARTVMSYVDFRAEVRTRDLLAAAWQDGKRVVVPYCAGGRLHLFRLLDMDELAPGTWEILEPRHELRSHVDRHVDVAQLDLIVVPGLAFDRNGGRIGYGKGYYDNLLRRVRPPAALVAVAFDCQVFEEIPMLAHDVFMHKVITEKAVYATEPRWAMS